MGAPIQSYCEGVEHFDFPPIEESFETEAEPDASPDFLTQDSSPLVVPETPRKPPVPLLFAAASERFQNWEAADKMPQPETPQRAVASHANPSSRAADLAMEQESEYQDYLSEAALGGSSTYQKILSALKTGRVKAPRVQDSAH